MIRREEMKAKPHPQKGFGRVMEGMAPEQQKEIVKEAKQERNSEVMRLKEKFERKEGLDLKVKLDELFHTDPRKAEGLVLLMENTEKDALRNRTLLENKKLMEEANTSDFLGITPQDIVKVVRIAYPNSVAQDIFDFWGMSSMKDSIYKIEPLYGSMLNSAGAADATPRGATAGGVTYENYSQGRYPSEFESFETLDTSGGLQTYTDTLDYFPLLPFKVSVVNEGEIIAVDDGSGAFVGDDIDTTSTNTIDYDTGDFTITFKAGTITADDELYLYYARNSEDSTLFYRTGSVVMNLVAYDFRAHMWPMTIEWNRMTEELMDSKLGLSARDTLIAMTADEYRKAMDEYCITFGLRASKWATAQSFNADFGAVGSDSSTEHAQGLLSAIINAELKTYNDLGRSADKSNIVVGTKAYSYVTKHKRFESITPTSKNGIYQIGNLDGRGIYVAPTGVVDETASDHGLMYIFGKGNDPMSTDAVVSVGTWKAQVTTNPIEFKNFNSEMGISMIGDIKINNKKFATSVEITNISRG